MLEVVDPQFRQLSPRGSMTSPPPSVTVMIRPAADETATRDGRRWPKQSRHTSQMDRLRKRGEELALAAHARPSGRDGVMASPPQPRQRWLLEGAGTAFQHVLTASTVTYDQAEHCPIRPRTWTDSQAIGGRPSEAVNAYGVRSLRI